MPQRVRTVGKHGRQSRNPPAVPTLPNMQLVNPPQSEEERQQERWRTWQDSPDTTRKGSGSFLEFICWEYLTKTKNLKAEVDFIYQYPLLGGRTQFGGTVADFYIPARALVWNPAGLQFHYTKTTDRARDRLQKAMLAARGIKVIYLFEDDLLGRQRFTLDNAWEGNQIGAREI